MMQNKLIENKVKVILKESYEGFEVCNPNNTDYNPTNPQLFRWGKIIVEKYKSHEEAKLEFEKAIRKNYNSDIIWFNSKFKDCKGIFWLDGIKINWELKTNYISDYHIEFDSEKIPNLLTDTGYQSCFPQNLDCYDTIEEFFKDYLNYEINCDEKGKENKRLINYNLSFSEDKIRKKQFTLIEMKGGDKNGRK